LIEQICSIKFSFSNLPKQKIQRFSSERQSHGRWSHAKNAVVIRQTAARGRRSPFEKGLICDVWQENERQCEKVRKTIYWDLTVSPGGYRSFSGPFRMLLQPAPIPVPSGRKVKVQLNVFQ